MPRFTITVNSQKHTIDAVPDLPLLWALRDILQLNGTKYGCGAGVCGACTVHQGRDAVRSCQIPLEEANGKSYTTIEGLSARGDHPCQRAWIEEDVSQCGYCQTGMIMAAAALLHRKPAPTDSEIDEAMSDSVCRCGTYNRMRRAIHRAAALASTRKS
jgi:isoquinoline 1-oxidoreductase alpha subunit